MHNEVPGINIPAETRQRIEKAGDNGAELGVQIARDLIAQLRPFVQGVYFIPAFGRYDLTAEVITAISIEPVSA